MPRRGGKGRGGWLPAGHLAQPQNAEQSPSPNLFPSPPPSLLLQQGAGGCCHVPAVLLCPAVAEQGGLCFRIPPSPGSRGRALLRVRVHRCHGWGQEGGSTLLDLSPVPSDSDIYEPKELHPGP